MSDNRPTASVKTYVAAGSAFMIVAALVTLILLGGQDDPPKKLTYRDVTKEYPDLRYQRRDLLTFRDPQALMTHVELMRGQALKRAIHVDFDDEMLAVVAMGARSSAGYRLKPVSVIETRNRILVKAREISPGRGSVAAAVLTYPYLALAIPRRDKAVQLEIVDS